MRLSFASPHLSIKHFPDTDLPDFTVVTGPNGAGKTHLLQSIHQGAIKCDLAQGQTLQDLSQIRYFDWNNMAPQDTGQFTSEALRAQYIQAIQQVRQFLNTNPHFLHHLVNTANSIGLPPDIVNDTMRLASLGLDEFSSILRKTPHEAEASFNQLLEAVTGVEQSMKPHVPFFELASIIAFQKKKPIIALEDADSNLRGLPSWGKAEVFQQQFGQLFVAYRDLYLANDLASYRHTMGKNSDPGLSSEQFVETYGEPPWNFVNRVLDEANLDFRINAPIDDDYAPYQPELTKKSTRQHVNFGTLSSGEKILMSFAFCVYYASDKRQLSNMPKLLLLDEIDAPLHPSMTKGLLSAIVDAIVKAAGVKVIVTTHSPSTVALAPEEALYTMTAGVAGLTKSTKSQALNILTVGVPTLSISYDGQRQIFVESAYDAHIYDLLFQSLKKELKSDLSLVFIGVGTRDSENQDRGSGCSNVKKIVGSLNSGGINTVYGLVDWDKTNNSCERIEVLSYGERDGLENVIFDPLLIACLIARRFKHHAADIGLLPSEDYFALRQFASDRLQVVSRAVAKKVLGSDATSEHSTHYRGGMVLHIDHRYLLLDDHELDKTLFNSFPYLNQISNRSNKGFELMKEVVTNVIPENIDFTPRTVFTTFENLLRKPAH